MYKQTIIDVPINVFTHYMHVHKLSYDTLNEQFSNRFCQQGPSSYLNDNINPNTNIYSNLRLNTNGKGGYLTRGREGTVNKCE